MNQTVAGVLARVTRQGERPLAEIDLVDVVKHDLRVEAFGVLQKALHQLWALHAHRVSGPIVNIGGGHQLPALCHAGDEHGRQVGARGVHGGGVAGGPRTQDQNAGVGAGGGGRSCHGRDRIEKLKNWKWAGWADQQEGGEIGWGVAQIRRLAPRGRQHLGLQGLRSAQ
jgi:hypothetical protein